MNCFLFVLALIVICLGGVAFCPGWFSTETNTADHKTNVNVSVDRERLQDDLHAVKEKAEQMFEKKESVKSPSPPKN